MYSVSESETTQGCTWTYHTAQRLREQHIPSRCHFIVVVNVFVTCIFSEDSRYFPSSILLCTLLFLFHFLIVSVETSLFSADRTLSVCFLVVLVVFDLLSVVCCTSFIQVACQCFVKWCCEWSGLVNGLVQSSLTAFDESLLSTPLFFSRLFCLCRHLYFFCFCRLSSFRYLFMVIFIVQPQHPPCILCLFHIVVFFVCRMLPSSFFLLVVPLRAPFVIFSRVPSRPHHPPPSRPLPRASTKKTAAFCSVLTAVSPTKKSTPTQWSR